MPCFNGFGSRFDTFRAENRKKGTRSGRKAHPGALKGGLSLLSVSEQAEEPTRAVFIAERQNRNSRRYPISIIRRGNHSGHGENHRFS